MSVKEGKSFRLDAVRADGWLERLGEGSPTFGQLCDIIGTRFVAFAVVAGVRIQSVAVDSRNQDSSTITFTLGESGSAQRLALGEFRRRLAAALVSDDEPPGKLPADPKPDDLSAFIGFRYVLLASVFGISLAELEVSPRGEASIRVELGGASDVLSIGDFREIIRDRIRSEAARAKPQTPFAIDLNVVPKAMAAAEIGDHDEVAELLGAWPGPLSLLLRTAEGAALTRDVRATLARALGALGTAYDQLGRADWAQEVLRLAIQWAQDGDAAGELFVRLGRAHVRAERHGEAIGLFRRALQLGVPERDLLPLLAHAFAARQRHVAALVCADLALRAGANVAAVSEVQREALGALGEPWHAFRRYVSEA